MTSTTDASSTDRTIVEGSESDEKTMTMKLYLGISARLCALCFVVVHMTFQAAGCRLEISTLSVELHTTNVRVSITLGGRGVPSQPKPTTRFD